MVINLSRIVHIECRHRSCCKGKWSNTCSHTSCRWKNFHTRTLINKLVVTSIPPNGVSEIREGNIPSWVRVSVVNRVILLKHTVIFRLVVSWDTVFDVLCSPTSYLVSIPKLVLLTCIRIDKSHTHDSRCSSTILISQLNRYWISERLAFLNCCWWRNLLWNCKVVARDTQEVWHNSHWRQIKLKYIRVIDLRPHACNTIYRYHKVSDEFCASDDC